jgi:hypothetical protein
MAQAATMGPPLSPKEIRRSGRRSIPSASTSASKSPDLDPAPKQKEITNRPALTSNSSGRQKRLKQEDLDELVDDRKNGSAPSTSSASSTHGTTTNGRTKRKAKEKEKDKQVVIDVAVGEVIAGQPGNPLINAPEEEEQGITRCVCGSTGMFFIFRYIHYLPSHSEFL